MNSFAAVEADDIVGNISSSATSHLVFGDDEVSTDFYSLPPEISPSQYVILEAFNRTHHHPQDWGMKVGSNFDLSMLVRTSSNQDKEQPKLEDFDGSNSFANKPNFDGLLTNNIISATGAANAANPLGISMIKTLLRNQPAPQQQIEGYSGDGESSASENK